MPRSMEELEHQIREVYGDHEASVENRINKAKMDMELAPLFRNIVSNEDTDKAVQQIKAKILEVLKEDEQ